MAANLIIYDSLDGKASVALYARDGDVWVNQNQLSEFFDTSKQNTGQHIKTMLKERELEENSVVKNSLQLPMMVQEKDFFKQIESTSKKLKR